VNRPKTLDDLIAEQVKEIRRLSKDLKRSRDFEVKEALMEILEQRWEILENLRKIKEERER